MLKLFDNLIKLIISVKNVLIRVEPMMVVVQVDLVSAAHVSFTPILFSKTFAVFMPQNCHIFKKNQLFVKMNFLYMVNY